LESNPNKRSTYQTVFAWIFAVLFTISAVGVIFTYFPIKKLLSPDFYQQALTQVNIYQRLPEALAAEIAGELNPDPGSSNSGLSFVVLSAQEWENILIDLIDPQWLQSQTDLVFDQVFDLLLISPDPINTPIEIEISDLKQKVSGPDGIQAINQIIEAQPPCSLDQLISLVQIGIGMEHSQGSILCRPPDYILSEINPLVESFLTQSVSQLPDYMQFYIPFPVPENDISGSLSTGSIPEYLQQLRRVNSVTSWSPLLPLTFLILMTLVVVRTARDFMAWWGATLFTAGLTSLIFSAFFIPLISWIFSTYSPLGFTNAINIPEFLVNMGIPDLYTQLVDQLRYSIILPAGILTGTGFALLVGFYFLPRISPKNKGQESESLNTQHVDSIATKHDTPV
jgi:hypothetical protein